MRKVIWIFIAITVLLRVDSASGTVERKQRPKSRPRVTREPPKGEAGRSRIVIAAANKQNAEAKQSTKYDTNRSIVRSRTCSFVRLTQNPTYGKPGDPVYAYGTKNCTDGTVIQGAFCVSNCPGAATTTERVELPSLPEIAANLYPPLPTPRFSPPLADVKASNIGGYLVGMRTYFAVEPDSWVDVVVSPLTRAGATLTLTAVPKALEITVADETFECDGPGVVITKANVNQIDSLSDKCSVVFEDAGQESVEVRIRYENVYGATGFPVPPVLPVGEPSFSPPLALVLPIVEVQPVLRTIE
jgi:hypothetical protein